jgi:5-methylcytosine-specific restriction enzyme B
MKNYENKFSWIQTHKELVKYLEDKENDQKGIIEILKNVGITPLNDEIIKGEKSDLSEIDPFTFFFYIYKYGSEKRLEYLQKIAKLLNLTIPSGEAGIPSANAQSVWLFPYKYVRKNNEIKRLWSLFYAAINNQLTDELFDDVLNIRNVAKTKLTEALFIINPERYLPINRPIKTYIEEKIGFKTSFNSFSEYVELLNQIQTKTNIPFYELSYLAWEWSNDKNMESINWTDEELKAAVYSYMEMFEKHTNNESFTKQEYYKKLASKYDRTEKAFGYRMQNISHVLKEMGRDWLVGLAPAKNVGTNTEEIIKKFIHEYEGDTEKQINPKVYHQQFHLDVFITHLNSSGLQFSKRILSRFISSLITKPFVIFTGLSGSGKTKLAQAFAQWICQDENQYKIIPVGADWTNREPLLGYPNALDPKEYVKPDNDALKLILQANQHPNLPYFLILDEMNLSHVERYFADFLSVMESKEEIPLYAEGSVENGVPAKLKVPSNLFIIGTVNIDETTNMFSPKVLDRANTIEFRVTQSEMKDFLENIKEINMEALIAKGAVMANSFLELAANKSFASNDIENINSALVQFFSELKKTGAEFGYRSASEILRLINQLTVLDVNLTTNDKVDIAIIQKLLPKLHGSRRKLCPVLETLGKFCISGEVKIIKDVFENTDFDFNDPNVLYPLSLEKITRMYQGAVDNGFASFAEA